MDPSIERLASEFVRVDSAMALIEAGTGFDELTTLYDATKTELAARRAELDLELDSHRQKLNEFETLNAVRIAAGLGKVPSIYDQEDVDYLRASSEVVPEAQEDITSETAPHNETVADNAYGTELITSDLFPQSYDNLHPSNHAPGLATHFKKPRSQQIVRAMTMPDEANGATLAVVVADKLVYFTPLQKVFLAKLKNTIADMTLTAASDYPDYRDALSLSRTQIVEQVADSVGGYVNKPTSYERRIGQAIGIIEITLAHMVRTLGDETSANSGLIELVRWSDLNPGDEAVESMRLRQPYANRQEYLDAVAVEQVDAAVVARDSNPVETSVKLDAPTRPHLTLVEDTAVSEVSETARIRQQKQPETAMLAEEARRHDLRMRVSSDELACAIGETFMFFANGTKANLPIHYRREFLELIAYVRTGNQPVDHMVFLVGKIGGATAARNSQNVREFNDALDAIAGNQGTGVLFNYDGRLIKPSQSLGRPGQVLAVNESELELLSSTEAYIKKSLRAGGDLLRPDHIPKRVFGVAARNVIHDSAYWRQPYFKKQKGYADIMIRFLFEEVRASFTGETATKSTKVATRQLA